MGINIHVYVDMFLLGGGIPACNPGFGSEVLPAHLRLLSIRKGSRGKASMVQGLLVASCSISAWRGHFLSLLF